MMMLTGRRTRMTRRALRRMVARSFAAGAADADWGSGMEPLRELVRRGLEDDLPDDSEVSAG